MSYICQVSNFSQFSSCQTFPLPVKNFSTQIAQEASRCTLSSSKPKLGRNKKKNSINNLKRNFPWKQWENLFGREKFNDIIQIIEESRLSSAFLLSSIDPRVSFFRVISIGDTWKGGSKIEKESAELRDNLYRKRVEDLAEAGAEPLLCENERARTARETRPNWSSKQKHCCTMLSIRRLRRQRDNNHAGLKTSPRVRCHVQWYEIWIRTIRPT